jgi:hypothetical protein
LSDGRVVNCVVFTYPDEVRCGAELRKLCIQGCIECWEGGELRQVHVSRYEVKCGAEPIKFTFYPGLY